MAGKSEQTLDLRGALTFIGLLKVCRTFEDLEPGQTLVVKTDVRTMEEDILSILDSCRLESVSSQELDQVVVLTIVKKNGEPGGSQRFQCGGTP